jgi:hypothetical protein
MSGEIKVLSGLPEFISEKPSDEELQRTAKWFEDRRGKFTGSKFKDLMGTTTATRKYEWGRPEKLIDFSKTAIKYISSRPKERQRGKVIKTAVSYAMRYGTEQEKTIKKLLLSKYYPTGATIEDVEFVEFIADIAGASPDGRMFINEEEFGLEIKASTSWDTLYDRVEVPFDIKHQDFWQIQAEMLALKVNKVLYVIAEPSEDIFNPKITDLEILTVQASPIHQDAIIKRCLIANKIAERFLEGYRMESAVAEVCSNYELND